ncbi:MAG: regulator of protease activity HflC (stomatin/prohibitin superfamily) [Sphingobacteriales bacterium]|jgi:regulator of protease activity HflC (stomatin/prohibitin superfamily)
MYDNKKITSAVIIAVLIITIISIGSCGTAVLKPGEQGVLFKTFSNGVDKDKLYGQGFHVFAPWNRLITYDCRKHETQETMDVLSSNGLPIKVDISIRFNPLPLKIGYLHETVGSEYLFRIIQPEVRSATRQIIGRYTPEELYSTKREEVQKAIYDKTKTILIENHIELDAILIRSVELPIQISEAIQKKLKQEQESLEYDFKITKEIKEAERKKIEAKGIQEFQDIVTLGISNKLLKWKGIEATEKLATSPNSKVVIIGGEDGLPIILNNN